MIKLELQPLEAEVLSEALRSYLSDLQTEISHTDTREYREGLKSQQAMLEALLQRIDSRPRSASGV